MKGRGLAEMGGVLGFGLSAILGFSASQSRQPYSLTEIQFCPKSVNGLKGQERLDRLYCRRSRYVLSEEWERYGRFNSILPYKGEAILKVSELRTDNPYQILGNGVSVISLWGLTGCLLVRVNRLKRRDFELAEAEKTESYSRWQEEFSKREVRRHKVWLDTEITKDKKSQYDLLLRKELGLRDDENEAIRSQLKLEDYLKARQTEHSLMEKQIAENLRDAAKAEHESRRYQTAKVRDFNQPASNTPEARKKLITQKLKEHEDGWLWAVVTSKKPLWVVGEQGSGKSSFATAVCLTRYGLFGWQLRLVVDAHGQKNIHDAWKPLSEVFSNFRERLVGSNNNHAQIAEAFLESINIWGKRMGENPKPDYVQSIYDEMTQLSIEPECREAVKAFVRHSMSDTRGGRDRIICIAHTFTNAATGDAAGFKELRDKSVSLVERFSEDGERPKREALYRVSGAEQSVTIPDWFSPVEIKRQLFEG